MSNEERVQTSEARAKAIGALAPTGSKKSVSSVRPRVFQYANFREYLEDWFQSRKLENSAYSGAMFAKRAGLSAHTLLGMVIRGQRNLSHKTIRAFVRALDLSGKEALFFEKLVLFNQSIKAEDKSFYLEQLSSISQGEGKALLSRIRNHAAYLSHWYVVAIRELVRVPGFSPEPEWICKRLKGKITRKEAQEAWVLLNDLGMVEKDASGTYRILHPGLDIDPGHVDFAIRNFHREYLDRARRAVDEESLNERELSSLTMSVSEKDLPTIRQRIKDFRKTLNQEFLDPKDSVKHVIAINMQLLVLTDSLSEKEKINESKGASSERKEKR